MQKLLLLFLAAPLMAQQTLSLKDAVRTALENNPAIERAAAGLEAARARRSAAASGYLPRLSYSESWQRSDNPVFVFSSLLTQHQFTEKNFAIGPLNRPPALNNFQSQLMLDQNLWDAGLTRKQVENADLGRQMAAEQAAQTRSAIIAGVVRAYYGAMLAREALSVARAAVQSAEADLERAVNMRAAGMTTDADVLAIRVHLAALREQQISRDYDAQVAMAALNEALGLPLDTPHELVTPLAPAGVDETPLAEKLESAKALRPEIRQAGIGIKMAETQSALARAGRLPQVSFRLAFEADRRQFINEGGANWLAAVSLRWNLFDGFATKARLAEAGQAARQARAAQRQIDAGVSLEVRRTYLELKASQERISVAEAAVAEAEETLRIVKNRYENGLTTITELLRSETALAEARLRRLAAIHDQRLAAAALELAAGSLGPDSRVLN